MDRGLSTRNRTEQESILCSGYGTEIGGGILFQIEGVVKHRNGTGGIDPFHSRFRPESEFSGSFKM